VARFDSRGGHPWFSHRVFHLFDLIWWFCEQLMRSREEIRVRASCYDNEQYANSKYTITWDHLLCQKATLFRELGINSIVPSIWRSCLATSRAVLFTYWDEWRRNSGITMAFYVMCSGMLVTCLKRTCSIRKRYLRVSSDDLRCGLVRRSYKGKNGPLNVRRWYFLSRILPRIINVRSFDALHFAGLPRPYALVASRLQQRLVGWLIIWSSVGWFW
jgi:hypothetical protein